jgi:tetratricopeptide (TPR) repeat protein
VHPVVDVVVGTGALALPLTALASVVGARGGTTALVVTAALTALLYHPHVAATCRRAWRLPGPRLALQVATVVVVLVALFARLQPGVLPALFTAWLVVAPFHAAADNAHVGAIFAVRRGVVVAAGEHVALKGAHHLLAAAAVVALLVGPREPLLYRLGLPARAGTLAAAIAVVVALGVAVVVVVRWRRRGTGGATLALALLPLITSATWMALPALLGWQGAFVYAGGVVAVLHGAQGLWASWFVEGRAARARHGTVDGVAWLALVGAGGVALFVLWPWLLTKTVGDDLLVALLIVQALVNLHHVVVHAVVQRAERAAGLWQGDGGAPSGRAQVSNARAAVWTVPLVLLAMLGILDVQQFAGSVDDLDTDGHDLARALVLNEADSRLWVRQAEQAIAHGDVDGARAHLGRALTLSPWNSDAQTMLMRVHVSTGRDDEAEALRNALPPGIASLASIQTLGAGVALRRGRLDDAVALARAALAATDGFVPALALESRGILGAALFAQGDTAGARVPLKEALEQARALAGEDALAQGNFPDVGLVLAEVDLALGQHDPALITIERVLDGAQVTRRVDVAVRALILRGAVFQRREDAREALSTWQQALRTARAQKEAATTPLWRRDVAPRVARGWLDYGGLLAQSDAPMRARLACALLARDAASSMPDGRAKSDLLKFIDEAAGFVEAVLPADVVQALRADLDAAANEALALGYPAP